MVPKVFAYGNLEAIDCKCSDGKMSAGPSIRPVAKRRSRRIKLTTRVTISPAESATDFPPIEVTATNLNQHGGLLRSEHPLVMQSHVRLTNQQGKSAIAKVVTEIRPHKTHRQYGVEFIHSNSGAFFWGISF